MKRALVCGAGGFIGGHLIERLKSEGYWVRGVDIAAPEFRASAADEFLYLDLRDYMEALRAVCGEFDEVYQLAADMGGMGYISTAECQIMRNNALINSNMIHVTAQADIPRYFFSSSVCVYRDMAIGEPSLDEDGAYPAQPHNEYGWEKLYAERMAMAYGRRYGIDVRIARFQNTYGPYGTWQGGREKAPAAICRKVAQAEDGGEIEVWGDGTAVRSYTYVSDLIDGIRHLMESDLQGPCNIGSHEYVTVDVLARTVIEESGKSLTIRHVPGPVGVQSRNFSHERIHSTGWYPQWPLQWGIHITYPWIAEQVRRRGHDC